MERRNPNQVSWQASNKANIKKALLIVDLQNDFCPGGALAVAGGDQIIDNINKYIQIFLEHGLPIFASRDWHPQKSKHFKKFGGNWPEHCIQDTVGVQFHQQLKLPKEAIILSKGMDPENDSYSVFDSFDENSAPFTSLLKIFEIRELYVCGLATDYCVKSSTIDALKAGFKVQLLIDAIKGVDVHPGDSERALKEMVSYGAKKTTLDTISWK